MQQFKYYEYASASNAAADSDHKLTSPMPGTIIAILTEAGKKVVRGDQLIIVEAMKMEHAIKAPHDGVIASINFKVGDQVSEGIELLSFEVAP
jgi:3-methylcrotonyl-CoA carboxylase alpha subunit